MCKEENIKLINCIRGSGVVTVLKNQYKNLYNEIDNKYSQLTGYPFKHKLYWYVHDIHDFPKCKICGNNITRVIYSFSAGIGTNMCSRQCSNKSSETKNKCKQTCIEKYGTEYSSQSKNNKEKTKQTCLLRYGVETSGHSKDANIKRNQTCMQRYGVNHHWQAKNIQEKRNLTYLSHYGVIHPLQLEGIREKSKTTCMRKYGVKHPAQSPIFQEKAYNTKKSNNSFTVSKIEQKIYQLLLEKYPDTQKQYKSEKYPFYCDFYIPSIDKYIELNFIWMHGTEPYIGSETQQNTVELWRKKSTELNFIGKQKTAYTNAIKIWTIKDPIKRQWAVDHNLNWLCFYNIKQFDEWFNLL